MLRISGQHYWDGEHWDGELLLEVRRVTVAVQGLTFLNLNPLHKDNQN
jgi:hypothetical protein